MIEILVNIWRQIWTDPHKEVFRAWLGTAIRAGLVSAGVYLKATGKFPFISDATMARIADYAPQLAGDAIVLIGLIWSAVEKWIADREKKTALAMPQGSTPTELKVVLKATSPGLIPTPEQAAMIVATAPKPEVPQ